MEVSTRRKRLWSVRPCRRGSSLPTGRVASGFFLFGLAAWSVVGYSPALFFFFSFSLSSFPFLSQIGNPGPSVVPRQWAVSLVLVPLGNLVCLAVFGSQSLGDSQWGVEGMISERGTTRACQACFGFRCCGSVGRGAWRLGKVRWENNIIVLALDKQTMSHQQGGRRVLGS